MTDLKELISGINNNPACMANVRWIEVTHKYSQGRLEEIMKGINDLDVLEDITRRIKREAMKYGLMNHPTYSFAKYKYDEPTNPTGEIIECNLYDFLSNYLEKRKRMRDLMREVARCNATPISIEDQKEEEKSMLQNVQRNVFVDEDAIAIWNKLEEMGYVDENIQPVNLSLSMMRAVVKAFYYAWDKEDLSWVPFKERWGKDLQHAKDSQESDRLCERLKEQL